VRRLIFAFVSTTALVPLVPAIAQAQSATRQNASIADCDRLVSVLEEQNTPNVVLSVEQAKRYKTENNAQACHEALARIDSTGGKQEERVVIQQPAPKVQVEQASPQVKVAQPQPQVTVKQGAPDIMVRQPAPTVTIDIPQPEITVRMPKPDVNVAIAQPQVEVNQPKPRVEVVQSAQPEVQVEPTQPKATVQQSATTQPNVTTQEAQAQPQVHYERAEPKVVINQPQGQPQIHVEQLEESARTGEKASQQANVPTTGGIPAGKEQVGKSIVVSQLLKLKVKNATGEELGTVERVVSNTADSKRYVIIGHGGFLGLGEKQVAVPIEDVSVKDGEVVLRRNITDDQIRAMPSWDRKNQNYRDVDANQTVQVSQG